jgi:hypothetical protein
MNTIAKLQMLALSLDEMVEDDASDARLKNWAYVVGMQARDMITRLVEKSDDSLVSAWGECG